MLKELNTYIKNMSIEDAKKHFIENNKELFLFGELKRSSGKTVFEIFDKNFFDTIISDNITAENILNNKIKLQLIYYSNNLNLTKTINNAGAFMLKEIEFGQSHLIDSFKINQNKNLFEKTSLPFTNGNETGLSSLIVILRNLNEEIADIDLESAILCNSNLGTILYDNEVEIYIAKLNLIKNILQASTFNWNNEFKSDMPFSARITIPFNDKYLNLNIINSITSTETLSNILRSDKKYYYFRINFLEQVNKPQNFIFPNRGFANGYSIFKSREINFSSQLKDLTHLSIDELKEEKDLIVFINYVIKQRKNFESIQQMFSNIKKDTDFNYLNNILIGYIKYVDSNLSERYCLDEDDSKDIILYQLARLFNINDEKIKKIKELL